MTSRLAVVLIVISLFFIIYHFGFSTKKEKIAAENIKSLTEKGLPISQDVGEPVVPNGVTTGVASPFDQLQKIAALKDIVPSITTVREELLEDPHTSPRSYLAWSMELGAKLELAMKDEKKANALFDELFECAKDDRIETTDVIRAVCLLTAERLANTFTVLMPQLDKLMAEVAQPVRNLAK